MSRKRVTDLPGYFVQPTIVEMKHDAPIVKTELFVPVLHVMKIKSFEEAVEWNNEVPQGLSSSLFTNNQQYVFRWTGMLCVGEGVRGVEGVGRDGGEWCGVVLFVHLFLMHLK